MHEILKPEGKHFSFICCFVVFKISSPMKTSIHWEIKISRVRQKRKKVHQLTGDTYSATVYQYCLKPSNLHSILVIVFMAQSLQAPKSASSWSLHPGPNSNDSGPHTPMLWFIDDATRLCALPTHGIT